MNIDGIQEVEDEKVLDSQHLERVRGLLILKVDLSKKEEDNMQFQTFNVIRRAKKWLRERKTGELDSAKATTQQKLMQSSLETSPVCTDEIVKCPFACQTESEINPPAKKQALH